MHLWLWNQREMIYSRHSRSEEYKKDSVR